MDETSSPGGEERAGRRAASEGAGGAVETDLVDHIVAAWRRQRPDLDSSAKEVTGRVARLHGLSQREFLRDYAADGIDDGEFAVLAALRRLGRSFVLTPTELNRELLISSGGVTHLVDRLVRRKLVTRRPDPRDRRRVRIALTPAGREVADRAMTAHAATEQRLVSALTDGERRQLAALLRKLTVSLEPPALSRRTTAPGVADDGLMLGVIARYEE